MIDQEKIHYVFKYFSYLMSEIEKLTLKHYISNYKSSNNPTMKRLMIEKGWISSDPMVIALLENGYEEFQLNVARRIMNESSEKVFFNNCPKCDKLARTPHAKQCRYCGYSWHYLTVAKFKINSTIQITERNFFLIGQITEGEIKEGQRIDLRILGLNKKIKIESIEFALKRQNEQSWEDIALGTNSLTEKDKQYLKNICPVREPLDIIKE